MNNWLSSDEIRARFSRAMSAMYKTEVPAYGTLIDLVSDINREVLAAESAHSAESAIGESGVQRLSEERHGAIRVGTAAELQQLRRVFAVMGMVAVGYYDLSTAGIPVHSTAFRPIDYAALEYNPFRVFTSLVRLELIDDTHLRATAADILEQRQILSDDAMQFVELAEAQGGLNEVQAEQFIAAVLDTFRWHDKASVDADTYQQLHQQHRLLADVISFQGPHINHLTPRTLDIDRALTAMQQHGLRTKTTVEGPPRRQCPILLRQTSFLALNEAVKFPTVDSNGKTTWIDGNHTARFGEIEQRGVALTPKGRALYDQLLHNTREQVSLQSDGENAADYMQVLQQNFNDFPDDWDAMRQQNLAYFRYFWREKPQSQSALVNLADIATNTDSLEVAITAGAIGYEPIIYEDFLPVSAAGIFQSNLGDDAQSDINQQGSKTTFEHALGTSVLDEFKLYEKIQTDSLNALNSF